MLLTAATGFAQTTFQLVTSASDLEAGKKYIIVGENDGTYYAMSKQNVTNTSENRRTVAVTENGGKITVEVATEATADAVFQFELGGQTGAWTFYDDVTGGYLCATSSTKNKLGTRETLDDNGRWSINVLANALDSIMAQGDSTRNIMRFNYNNGTPLFACYGASNTSLAHPALYKEQSETEVLPEPTNYPTNFFVTNSVFDAYVSWTDAIGGQLPQGYLIIGVESHVTIETPVDGTPVPNDTPHFIVNIPYGVEHCILPGLELNKEYTFKIFPYTNSGSIIDYKTDGTVPSSTFTVNNMAILLNEPFDEDLGVFTAFNVEGNQTWAHNTHNDDNFAQMSGYADGSSHANEDWLISPVINGNTPKVMLQFRTAKNYSGNPLALKISTDYNATAGPDAATWTDITDLFEWSNGGFTWVETSHDIVSYTYGGNFNIAFVYTSTDENSSTWEIDYVRIIASDLNGVAENDTKTFSVYPNPASQQVTINAETSTTAVVYDATGRKVMEMNVVEGENTINVQNLENGVYFIMMDNAVSKFMKY